MSCEDDHYRPLTASASISNAEIAGLRQELYDAKLALSSGDLRVVERKLIEALDRTTRWPR